MSKFGNIINVDKPVLIGFYADWDEIDNQTETLHAVADALGDKAKVIKIEIEKNATLVTALRVKKSPTFIIYKNSEMKWRKTDIQDANTLISLVEQYV